MEHVISHHPLSVCFDLDDTLMDHESAVIAGARDFYHGHRDIFDMPEDEFVACWVHRIEAAYQRYLYSGMSIAEARRWRVKSIFSEAGVPLSDAAADAKAELSVAAYQNHWRLFDDVEACLQSLAGRYPMAVITNGSSGQQWEKLHRLGLSDRFDAVIVSEAAGCAKPAPEIFWEACRALDMAPARSIHVGDRWDIDIAGSRHAGFRAVWLNRRGHPCPGDASEAVELSGLDGLPRLVNTLSGIED